MQSLSEQITSLTTSLQAAESKSTDLNAKHSALQSDLDAARTLSAATGDTSKRLEQLEATSLDLRNQLEAAKKSAASAESLQTKAEEEIKEERAKREENEKEHEDLLVLLEELSQKRRRDREKMKAKGMDVSEDEDEEE